LTPEQEIPKALPSPHRSTDVSRLLQAHLKRVGCNAGNADGTWTTVAQGARPLQ